MRTTTNGGPTYTQSYAYDPNDNRTGLTASGVTTSSTFDAANQLVSVGASAYRYDRDANLTAAGADTYTYDAANHFSGGSLGGVSQAFSYDGLGRRVSRAPNGSRLDAWYDLTGLTSETGGAPGTYLRDPTGLLLSAFSSGALRDYGRDRLGSLTAMVNTAGSIDNAYQYDPWGGRITNTGTAVNPFKFTAGYQSTSSGLFDFAARSYDPGTGRFTQADPRPSSVTDINRFAYVGCNPVNATDPSGLGTWQGWPFGGCDALKLGAGLGLVWGGLGIDTASALALVFNVGIAAPEAAIGLLSGTTTAINGWNLIVEACPWI